MMGVSFGYIHEYNIYRSAFYYLLFIRQVKANSLRSL